MRSSFIIVAASFAALLSVAGQAQAQANRTFVSGHGSDSNPCSLTAPCRTFSQAITQTNAGGEIAVLDTAGYGPVTITKAVSIINQDGVEAGITTVSAGDGVTVSAGSGDVVNLRGLALTGIGVGTNGITFKSGLSLNIQNCIVRGFTNDGLHLVPTTIADINVADAVLSGNGNDGITFRPTVTGNALFERVQVLDNTNNGIVVEGDMAPSGNTIDVTAADSVVSGNGSGLEVFGAVNETQPTLISVNTKSFNNFVGLVAFGATMIIAQTQVSGNIGKGFSISNGGTIKSFNNNFITDVVNTGQLTAIGQQ